MNELKLDLIQKLCDEHSIIWSVHATERMNQRGIGRKDVLNAIQNGTIIEQYPDDYPYPSCLILGSLLLDFRNRFTKSKDSYCMRFRWKHNKNNYSILSDR